MAHAHVPLAVAHVQQLIVLPGFSAALPLCVSVVIHVRIRCRDKRSFGAETWFDDDPRVDREAREEAARDRIAIRPVAVDAQGHASIEARIELD